MITIPLARPSEQGKKRCAKVVGTTHLIGSIRSGVDCYYFPAHGRIAIYVGWQVLGADCFNSSVNHSL